MDIVVIVLTATGLLFFFATTIGLLRLPDFYSRMHAAGKGDTLSSLLMLLALVLYNFHEMNLANLLVALKILLIVVFIFMASPTATHAIIDAGYESGIQPWTKKPEEES
jgi:multicomponent Na+:H+ antiporter subunit G